MSRRLEATVRLVDHLALERLMATARSTTPAWEALYALARQHMIRARHEAQHGSNIAQAQKVALVRSARSAVRTGRAWRFHLSPVDPAVPAELYRRPIPVPLSPPLL